MKKVIVIGAGFGGLATAILLAKQGFTVKVLEKNNKAGGRANLLEAQGYKWDMGPSRYLMPDAFEKFFAAIGEKIPDHFSLQKLSPSYRVYFKNQSQESQQFDMYSDIQKAAEVFESIETGAGEQLRKYLASSAHQYDIAMNKFVYKNFDSLRDFLTPQLAIEGMQLNIFTSLYKYVSRFVKDERLKKILMYPSVFLGTSPYQTPALFNIMSHVDFNQGVFYPKGGIYEVSKALYNIALSAGVTFEFDTAVSNIEVQDGKVKGVQTKKGSEDGYHLADIVVSNADMHHTETRLLEDIHQSYPDSYWAKKTISPSGFILYLGVDGKLPQLQHHTLIFSENRKEGFDQIFSKPSRPTDPNYYICNPSKTDESVAPAGKENLFVLVPIAPGLEYNDEIIKKYSETIIADIAKTCNIPDLASRIEFTQTFSLPDFESYYNAYKGTALGLAHTFFQSSLRRPDNYSKKVEGLYYAGGYTTPGIGMPMCLISGMLVTERILKKYPLQGT